ncbi:HD-GYP domain-containing protein [Candidatus Ruminimicrobiellum ovillum]|uniref:HD-GYP domain-containing protein n=1 Tax=Candidatus Ruminimicrobiellum ovillum TaxID=1947927 RepID=UPI00355A0598
MIIKFIKKKINLIKICAVFTTVCFVVSTLGANLYAIPLAENANQKYEDVFNKVSSISAEYGKITSSKDVKSDITVINIQDLHCHPQTQRNISKIISQIADKYNLKKIYVEGGYGDIDVSWLDTIKDEKIKRQIIEGLLEEGILTGSEYYKLTNNNEVELKGIDEEQIHKDNVRRLSWIIENQSKYRDVITKVENEINILEKMYVNSRNERFNRDIEKYLTSKIDSRRFYRQLAKYVRDINENPEKYNNITAIRLEDYPNITKFIALRRTSKDIDVREVTQQLQMVINELKNKLPYNVYTKLLSETENLSDSQKVVELITMLCNKEGINLENRYKALNTFLESNGINRELNTVELVQEERQLLSEIRKALSYNNEEYEITFISDFSKYFKDYLEYKLTDADWKYFEKEFDQFITLYSKYATVNRIQEIYGDFEEINKYYKINDQRNNIFVSNLLKDEEISVSETDRVRQEEEILKNSKEVIIAVTGGFHSSELEEILAKKEVNTIVITPSIFEGIEKATKQYKGIIKDQSRFFQHQALAYTLASCSSTDYQKNLLYSMAKDILGGNVERLKEVFGGNVDLTVFDNLKPLTEQEQEQISDQKNLTAVAASIMVDFLPKQGGMTVLRPNTDSVILEISEKLVSEGIFLSKGPVFGAEEAGLPTLNGISPEVYSRMHTVIQEALLAAEGFSAEESYTESVTEEESVEEIEETEVSTEKEETEDKVDSSYLSEERKAELLGRFYNNNREAFYRLINICCRQSVQFDLSKDSALLDMFIRKYNSYGYDLDTMDEIIRRSVHVAKTFFFDTDLKFAAFEKFVDFFDDDSIDKNGEVEYIKYFRRLFALNQEYLKLFYEKIDGLSATDLVFYYEAEDINVGLNYLFKKFGKEITKLGEYDYIRLVDLFDNIEKLNYLSEEEFSYLMSLPNEIFSYVLKISADSSQLKTKLKVGRKYGDKKYDETLSKSIFANAEKLENLSVLYFIPFTNLNKEALIFILDNARNSSDIEKILSLYKGMGLSTQFDKSGSVNDFVDPRFKALVKYISIGDRDFYSKLFDYGSKTVNLIVDSVDAEFVRDYIFNPNYEEIYKKLFVGLVDLEIKSLAVENDYFALKLILNKDFNRILTEARLDNISDRDNIVARYYSAIAVSRMVYDGARQEVSDYSFENEKFASLMQKATSIYIRMMKAMLNVILIDSNTKIYALCNSERLFAKDRFNIDSLREIIEYMGIPIDIPEENVYKRLGNNDNASKMWLQAIENFIIDSDKTKGYFVFRGHGGEESLLVYDPGVRQNGLATGHKAERITPEQLADSLFKLATREQNPVNLKNITIDLSCCNSYFFARNVYDILEQKFRAENKAESYPTIITAAGLETKTGITDFRRMEGNLHKGINKLLRNFQRGSIPVLSLGMIGLSEYLFTESNITMFTSFFDKNLLKDISEIKREIYDYVNYEQVSRKEEVKISEEKEDDSEREKEKRGKLSAFLPTSVTEASVFGADKAAPVWEEVIYRAIPAMIFTGIIIAATMFFSAIPAVAIIAKMACIGIFSFFQTRFVAAHIVTDWVKAKDSGGPLVLRNLLENKDLTVKGKISKLLEIIKERILVIFPSSVLEKEFSIFYKTDNRADLHKKGLIIPTVTFTIPYIIAMIFFNSMPAVAIATIVSMIFHYINNKVAKTLEEKELLQEKAITKDFHDIQRRLRHVKLLIENPQVKVDLPVIKEGSFAIKFGLENIEERRAEYLLEYEKVRINFVERLNWEMAQAETVKNELERIGSKKRKTKKDREKIEELKEQLRRIENEYPKIKSELLFTDTKKVEEIIDKIDELLPIFEELDIILTMMENFIAANGDTKESRELEREFLEFAEQTFMKKLMSLYDAKVTGVHVRRVVSFSNLIGRNMPFGNNLRMMYKLMLSSILHDIGKNLVPEVILNKQGSFNELERDMMEFHVVFGGLILRSSILKELSYTAENHHFTKESSPKSYSYKTKMDYMFGSSHYEYDEEEAQIAKVVTLTDVYEAVSPKLSFATERTYQFARKIRDISNILENIDIGLNESQQKRVITLLSEIAQIENEEDIPKRQEMEQKFIKKVLYSHSKDIIINYIREQNNELVRENAFKIIFTESPQYIFNKLGKTRAEFLDDFKNDPKGTVDKCMSLVDNSNFEFDTEVVRAFLEFYFSYGDVRINDSILESLNKERENAFVVFIKDKSYSLYRIFKKFRTTVMMYAPIIASIFPEEEQTDFEKYFKNQKVVVQKIIFENGIKKVKGFEILEFGTKSVSKIIGRFSTSVSEGNYDNLGIIIEKDIYGNIISVKPKDGYEFSSLSIDGEPAQGNNLPFSVRQLSAMLRDSGILVAEAADIREDDVEQYVADIYLDDTEEELQNAMEDAIKNNKLMVIHVFRKGFSTKDLTLGQIRDKYVQAYSLLQKDKLKNLPILSEITQLGKDVETESVITFDFFLKELLKNHFGHGNLGLFEYPIACYISADGSKMLTYDSSLNLDNEEYKSPFGSEDFKNKGITSSVLEDLMKETLIHGDGQGRNYMNRSLLRNFQDGRVTIDGLHFYRAEVTSKLETEEQKEAAKQYKKEQDSKATKSAVTVATTAADWDDFWGLQTRDTVSRLYNRGLTKYLRQYLKQTGKLVENLTEEESAAIRQKAENYRFTLPGLAYGAFLEIFALWEPNFIDRHNFDSSTRAGMIAVVWTVRALSIGIGLTTAFLSVSALPVSTILLAAAVPTIFGTATISSSFVIHLLWNIGAVLTSNKGYLLQTGDEIDEKEETTETPKETEKVSTEKTEDKQDAASTHVQRPFKYTENQALGLSKVNRTNFIIDSTYNLRINDRRLFKFRENQDNEDEADNEDDQTEDKEKDLNPIEGFSFIKKTSEIKLTLKDGFSFVDEKDTKEITITVPATGKGKRFIKIKKDSKDPNEPEDVYVFYLSDTYFGKMEVLLDGKDKSLREIKSSGWIEIDVSYNSYQTKFTKKGLDIIELLDKKFDDLINQPFTIVEEKKGKKKKRTTFIFDSKSNTLFRILENGLLEKVEDHTQYGIQDFTPDGHGHISSFVLDYDIKLNFAVRQPVGMTDEEMEARMKQLHQNVAPEISVLDYINTVPKSFVRAFFEKEGFDSKIVDKIISKGEEGVISPEELEDILIFVKEEGKERGFFLEEDAKMWIERILAEYIFKTEYENEILECANKIFEKFQNGNLTDDQKTTVLHILGIDPKEVTSKDFKNLIGKQLIKKFRYGDLATLTEDEEKIFLLVSELPTELTEFKTYVSPYQMKRILVRSGISEKELDPENRNNKFSHDGVEEIGKSISDFRKFFMNTEQITMLIEALNRAFTLDRKTTRREYTVTKLRALISFLKGQTRKTNLVGLRGYFGEIYLANTKIAGKINGITLRLQLPTDTSAIGIDLIDPITGMQIQVKLGKVGETTGALNNYPRVPVFCSNETKQNGTYKDEPLSENPFVQGFVELDKITKFAKEFLSLLYEIEVRTKDNSLLIRTVKGEEYIEDITIIESKETEGTEETEETDKVTVDDIEKVLDILRKLIERRNEEEKNKAQASTAVPENSESEVAQEENGEEPVALNDNLSSTETDDDNAILPENMGLVNRIMQSKFGNAFVVATVIAFKEFKASMKPSFVDMHQSESGREGAQQLRDFITRFDVVETDGLAARIIKTILGTIVKGASIVKHIAIDYRYIKASGIQEAISMFGNNTYMDEYGQIHIPPVLIVNDLTGLKDLNNTGIKVNGRYIYQVGQKGILIYGAEGVNSEDISMAVNESQMIKYAIEQMIREKGYEGVSVEVDGVIQEEGEGVRFENGITIIGTEELQNQSATYIDGYVSSSIELKRSMGVMYSQKALINLESIVNIESLRQALKQGRARKIISKAQYDQLQMTYEEIMAMREAGIEIYVDSNAIDENLKKIGITGQIIRKDNQIFIHDYYTQEDVEVEEVSENNSLTDIENMLVNSQKLILIDIKVLANKFQKENILGAYKGLNNLIGNMKLKTGIGQLTETDIKSLGYNLDYNKLPQLTLTKPLQEYTKAEIEDMLTASILSMDTNTEIRIILKAIDKKDALKDLFTQIMKERILAKTALTQNYKEFGLKDKKMEILLGEMLYKQLDFSLEDKDPNNYDNIDITYIDDDGVRKEVTGKENDLIKKITQDTEKAMREDKVAINSIIEIILTYGDSYKDKQLARQLDVNDARNYRAMMSAA